MIKQLKLDFEGFFQCRLATDPDPPSERRGISGYTFAVGCESDLSQKLCLQQHEIKKGDFRQPFPPYLQQENPRFGVFVRRVRLEHHHLPDHPLEGAAVNWLDGPQFELRNQIVADGTNRLVPVIDPFKIEISRAGDVLLYRSDPLDPEHPECEIWQLRPEQYERRVPINFFMEGSEVIERLFHNEVEQLGSINAVYNAYFQARKEWLQLRMSKLQTGSVKPSPGCSVEVEIEGLKTRIYAIDEHTSIGGPDAPAGRMENRLAMQSTWRFPIVGDDAFAQGIPGGEVLTDRPWRTHFWIGGWDGD